MKFGLTDEELEFLIDNANDLGYEPDIKTSIKNEDVENLQTNINIYLVEDECMYYDSDGQNWYTKRGHYVQSLYDKILDWKYGDEED